MLLMLSRIAQATAALTRLKPVWNDRSISLSSKIRLTRSLVTLIFLYNLSEPQRKMQAMEMRCYRKILRISYKNHVTNEEVRAHIQKATEQNENLLTIVKRRKLHWHGHVSLSSGLPNPSCKAQGKGEEEKADRGRGWKTTSGNGQAWSSASPRGRWRTGKNGENWLQNHLWCPNDPRG